MARWLILKPPLVQEACQGNEAEPTALVILIDRFTDANEKTLVRF